MLGQEQPPLEPPPSEGYEALDQAPIDEVLEESDIEVTEDDFSEDEFSEEELVEDGGSQTAEEVDPAGLQDETNPLNPIGNDLDLLIQTEINDDVWAAMMGELPCLEATETCVRELQEMAIANNPTLMEIDARVEAINAKIDEARANNQASIRLGIFEPFIQDLIGIQTVSRVPDPLNPPTPGSIVVPEERGFLENVLSIFTNPVRGINEILSFIGVPLFRSMSGGDANQQQREIAIADLQVKVAEVERSRSEMANDLREEVMLQVLEFDTIRREFQISQESARRDTLRMEILTQNYRFAVGSMDTPAYLNQISALDQQKAQTFRAWARLRTQLTRIKILVIGAEQI